MKLILASQSPRRRQLLWQLGLDFQVVVSNAAEDIDACKDVDALVADLAYKKALDVSRRCEEGIIIGADTLVVLDDRPLGKPADEAEARKMLRSLSGRRHRVITGVAVMRVPGGLQLVDCVSTWVKFRTLSEEEIQAYLDSGEYKDKAGAYAIQGLGAIMVEGIEGCYFNVVGLPLARLTAMLRTVGVDVLGRGNNDQGNGD